MDSSINTGRLPVVATGALALVAAVAGVAVASPNATTSASAKKAAKKASKQAKAASEAASEASSAAAGAQSTANAAQAAAAQAQSTANAASAKVAGITEAKSGSASLVDGNTDRPLLRIGNVDLRADCVQLSVDEDLLVAINAVASAPGAVLVADGAIDGAKALNPGNPSPVMEQGSNGVINGSTRAFAILDGPRTTTGVASASVEKDTGTCEVAVSGIR